MSGIIWLDPVTGAYAQGTAEPFQNGYDPPPSIVAAGLTYSVAYTDFHTSGATFAIFGAVTSRTYLRQHQSPKSSPARVNQDPTIRMRQRFI